MLRPLLGAMAIAAFVMTFSSNAEAAPDATEAPDNVFTLVPGSGSTVILSCVNCALADPAYEIGAGPEEEAAFLGVDKDGIFKIDTILGTEGDEIDIGTLGPTKGIVIKQGNTSFFLLNSGPTEFVSVKLLEGSAFFSHLSYTPIPAGVLLLLTALAGVFGLKRFGTKRAEVDSRSSGELAPA